MSAGRTVTINIDTDKPCAACGKKGAMQNGYCMPCATKHLLPKAIDKIKRERGEMKQHLRVTEDSPRSFISIGPKCIDAACELLDQHLRMKANAIDAAYVKLDDGEKLNVSLSVKFSEGPQGSINVESQISFTAEKIKDTGGRLVNERQERLPGMEG